MALTTLVLAAPMVGMAALNRLRIKQKSSDNANVDQWKSWANDTNVTLLAFILTGVSKINPQQKMPHSRLATKPIIPATNVITRHSTKILIAISPRVAPKARRTPISSRRRTRRLWVIELRLTAGTISNIKKMMYLYLKITFKYVSAPSIQKATSI